LEKLSRDQEHFKPLARSLKARILTEEQSEQIIEEATSNRINSKREIKLHLELEASRETINRELLRKGYKAYKTPSKPNLTDFNKDERLACAYEYQDWTVDDWKCRVFSDESVFRLVSSNGRMYVRRREDEAYRPDTIQFSSDRTKSVMVWAISKDGVGPLVRVNGSMDGEECLNLFKYRLRKYYPGLYDGSMIFQDDNASCHTSRVVNT